MNTINRKAQVQEHGPGGRRLLPLIGLLAAIILASRIPGAMQARMGALMDTDELIMTHTVLDRFLGVPPAFLGWPGGTLQLLGLPVVAADLFCGMHFNLSAEGFMTQLAQSYREPWQVVFHLRCLVALCSSIGFASLLMPMARLGISRPVSIIGVLCLCSLPAVWMHSQMAVPDAVSIAFACLACAALSRERCTGLHFAFAGVLMGLGVAAKFTVAPLILFVIAVGLECPRKHRGAIPLFLVFLGVGFVFGSPYAWTDPVRCAKAVAGVLFLGRQGEAMGFLRSLLRMMHVVSPLLLFLALPGAYRLLKQRRWKTVVGAALSLCVVVGLTSSAGDVFDRYYLATTIPVALLAAAGFEWLACCISRLPFKSGPARSLIVVSALGVIVCTLGTVRYAGRLRDSLESFHKLESLVRKLESLGNKYTIIVPKDGSTLFERLAGHASSQSLELLAARIPKDPAFVAEFAHAGGLPRNVAYALASTINNQEQILSAHLYALSYPRDRDGFELLIFDEHDVARKRFGFLDLAEAVSLFQSRPACALVVEKQDAEPLLPGSVQVGNYLLWVKAP